jgi:hypothetical protein
MAQHPHKEIIDAWTADTSLEIEFYEPSLSKWFPSDLRALTAEAYAEQKFRIKPKTRSITVDGVLYEWPEPMRVAPEFGTAYWVISTYQNRVYGVSWTNCDYDKEAMKIGYMQATKEGAEAHRRALIAVSGGAFE